MKYFTMDTCKQKQRGGELCNCGQKEQLLTSHPFISYGGGNKRNQPPKPLQPAARPGQAEAPACSLAADLNVGLLAQESQPLRGPGMGTSALLCLSFLFKQLLGLETSLASLLDYGIVLGFGVLTFLSLWKDYVLQVISTQRRGGNDSCSHTLGRVALSLIPTAMLQAVRRQGCTFTCGVQLYPTLLRLDAMIQSEQHYFILQICEANPIMIFFSASIIQEMQY